jgi:hypothetical protein
VPELRRRIRAQTNQTLEELERRQFPWKGSGEYQRQAPAGGSGSSRAVLGRNQNHTAA